MTFATVSNFCDWNIQGWTWDITTLERERENRILSCVFFVSSQGMIRVHLAGRKSAVTTADSVYSTRNVLPSLRIYAAKVCIRRIVRKLAVCPIREV